jgi:hypothetical protein
MSALEYRFRNYFTGSDQEGAQVEQVAEAFEVIRLLNFVLFKIYLVYTWV